MQIMQNSPAFEHPPRTPSRSGGCFTTPPASAAILPAPRRYGRHDIRPVRTKFEHAVACLLVRQMYDRRGYDTTAFGGSSDDPNRITLAVWQDGKAVATLTIGRDSSSGLLADTLYRREIDHLRCSDRVICEASAFATHPEFSSGDMLFALFDSALHYSRDVWGASDAVIEVNPRHAPYYRHKFGFEQIGQLRQCPRVDAPAVLMHRSLGKLQIIPRQNIPG